MACADRSIQDAQKVHSHNALQDALPQAPCMVSASAVERTISLPNPSRLSAVNIRFCTTVRMAAYFTLLHMAAGPVLLGAVCGRGCTLGWAGWAPWAADAMPGSRVGSSFGGVPVCDMAARRDCSGSPGMPVAKLGSAAEPSREVNVPWLGVLTGRTGDAMAGALAGNPASTLVLIVRPPAGTAPRPTPIFTFDLSRHGLGQKSDFGKQAPPHLCVLMHLHREGQQ